MSRLVSFCAICLVVSLAAPALTAADGIPAVGSDDFQARVIESDQPVIVDFYGTWCAPCLEMAPVVAEVAQGYADRVAVYALDVDQAPDINERYNVDVYPTLIVFSGGEVVRKVEGVLTREEIDALFAAAAGG